MTKSRRDFIKTIGAGIALSGVSSLEALAGPAKPWFQISLAEWSVHKQIFDFTLDNLDFPAKAKNDFGISIVEYVNTCFKDKTRTFQENGSNTNYLRTLMQRCNDNGVTNHLIMCDAEGNLGDEDAAMRAQAIENHLKWLDAAAYLGCKSIRVNAAGRGTADEVAKNAADGLHSLGEKAAKMNLNVIVENHGGYSSDGKWLAGVMKSVGLKNVGTLPDFGNFCIERDQNNYQKCKKEYDRYKGVKELMPYAKGVSAKTNNFDANGNESIMDYKKLMKIVKKSGFRGIIGIEYEGNKLSEDDGIRATKKLLETFL